MMMVIASPWLHGVVGGVEMAGLLFGVLNTKPEYFITSIVSLCCIQIYSHRTPIGAKMIQRQVVQ